MGIDCSAGPAAAAVKTLWARWVFLPPQCSQAWGASASAMRRRASVVRLHLSHTYSYTGMVGSWLRRRGAVGRAGRPLIVAAGAGRGECDHFT
jgi:hypothetical protein